MENKIKNSFNWVRKVFNPFMFVGSLIYFGVFRYFVIPSGDDYFWWGPQGDYLSHHMFYGPQAIYGGSSNGRYLGNFFEIITMHNLTIAVIIYAFFWTLLLWGLWRLSSKSVLSLVLSFLFVFTLQDAFLNNILVWNAGFVNYVPPIALMLVYIFLVDRGRDKDLNQFIAIGTLILAYAGGLFTETMTVGQIVLGCLVILYFRKKTKLYHITYLLGAIISAITVFSHPGYQGHSSYRSMTFEPYKIWLNYSKITHFWLITFNLILLVAILLAVIILAIRSDFNFWKKGLLAVTALIFLIYYIGINHYLSSKPLNDMYGYNRIDDQLSNIEGIISLLLVIFIGSCIFIFFRKDAKLWLYYLMTGAIMGQLMFVASPINCRGNFLSYVFTYLIAMRFVLRAVKGLKLQKLITGILAVVLVAMGAHYLDIMQSNYQVNLQRVSVPDFYNGKSELTKHVPYRKFVWFNDLLNQQVPAYWKQYFKK